MFLLVSLVLLATAPWSLAVEPERSSAMAVGEVPKGKQTTLGLYVTAAQAYEMWKAAPATTKVVDVRAPEEYVFVGHAEMAWNVPLAFASYEMKDGKLKAHPRKNDAFVELVREIAQPTD
jgi:hypothetical protein